MAFDNIAIHKNATDGRTQKLIIIHELMGADLCFGRAIISRAKRWRAPPSRRRSAAINWLDNTLRRKETTLCAPWTQKINIYSWCWVFATGTTRCRQPSQWGFHEKPPHQCQQVRPDHRSNTHTYRQKKYTRRKTAYTSSIIFFTRHAYLYTNITAATYNIDESIRYLYK